MTKNELQRPHAYERRHPTGFVVLAGNSAASTTHEPGFRVRTCYGLSPAAEGRTARSVALFFLPRRAAHNNDVALHRDNNWPLAGKSLKRTGGTEIRIRPSHPKRVSGDRSLLLRRHSLNPVSAA